MTLQNAPAGRSRRRPPRLVLNLNLNLKPRAALAIAAALPCAVAHSALAGNSDTYLGPTGPWSTPASWSLGHQPAGGDVVLIQGSSGGNAIVTLDPAAIGGTFSTLTIDGASGGKPTLLQSANSLSAGIEHAGFNAAGGLTQSGGSNTLGSEL